MLLNKVEKILRRAQATGAATDVQRDGGRDVTGLRSEGIVRYGDALHLKKNIYIKPFTSLKLFWEGERNGYVPRRF